MIKEGIGEGGILYHSPIFLYIRGALKKLANHFKINLECLKNEELINLVKSHWIHFSPLLDAYETNHVESNLKVIKQKIKDWEKGRNCRISRSWRSYKGSSCLSHPQKGKVSLPRSLVWYEDVL